MIICFEYSIGVNILPEWVNEIPDNKAVVLMHYTKYNKEIQGEAEIYHSKKFKHLQMAKRVVSAAGFNLKY